MLKQFYLILLIITATAFQLSAQADVDEKLAIQYFQEKEFEKALPLFEKLYKRNPDNQHFYQYYLNTMLELQQFNEAEREIKRLIRRNPERLTLHVDLGMVYEKQGDTRKSTQQFEEAIKLLSPNNVRVHELANAFQRLRHHQFALNTYLKGRQLLNDRNLYTYQLAALYRVTGKLENMMDELLYIIDTHPQQLENIQNQLVHLMDDEGQYTQVRNYLIRKIQQDAGNNQYVELLSWMFIQQKDFNGAFVQLRAIDRRNKEFGMRLIPLAQVALQNNAYEVSERIYQYILDQGNDGPFFYAAQRGFLEIKYLKITKFQDFTDEEISELILAYETLLKNDRSRIDNKAPAILRLAELKALYHNEPAGAVSLLESLVQTQGLNRFLQGDAKLKAADYYILSGDIWEAALLYGQVEKDFRDHPLGHDAKFRNARLSFYRGEFDWAKAQLDVLKGSTSELIANDALLLALIIQDNRGLDTTDLPLSIYAEADFLMFKQHYSAAEAKLEELLEKFPGHALTDEVYYAKARIRKKQRRYAESLELLEKVYTIYSYDILADRALFMAAEINEFNIKDKEKARELYEQLILKHPDSVFSIEARKRYRLLRGEVMN